MACASCAGPVFSEATRLDGASPAGDDAGPVPVVDNTPILVCNPCPSDDAAALADGSVANDGDGAPDGDATVETGSTTADSAMDRSAPATTDGPGRAGFRNGRPRGSALHERVHDRRHAMHGERRRVVQRSGKWLHAVGPGNDVWPSPVMRSDRRYGVVRVRVDGLRRPGYHLPGRSDGRHLRPRLEHLPLRGVDDDLLGGDVLCGHEPDRAMLAHVHRQLRSRTDRLRPRRSRRLHACGQWVSGVWAAGSLGWNVDWRPFPDVPATTRTPPK